ncbi:MAG: hypothetical protein HYW63_03280 [Candidatus Levybacteria bacterium]|nr:hypothetical protein [Candidatus Levybacteria bacterium]
MKFKFIIAVALIVLAVAAIILNKEKNNKSLVDSTKSHQDLKKSESFSIVLNEQNASGQSGLATIEAKNDVIEVRILSVGFSPNINQGSNIHSGSCQNVGKEIYKLVPVANGKSETVIIATWKEFEDQLPLVLVINSPEELPSISSCGEISIQ